MNLGASPSQEVFRPRLLERRARLQAASRLAPAGELNRLLEEIDAALRRVEDGSFGICETCGDPIEADRLECDSLVRFCLDHLSPRELEAHQQDLDLASEIQTRLLPDQSVRPGTHWDAHYRYVPVGAVGGDYCELAAGGDGKPLFFAVGDVSGKGVAASLLMTHLSAIFRSLLSLDLPLEELMARANRLFCESTTASHYATLACGRATADDLTLCNAGHCEPILLRDDGVLRFEATGLPLGLFCAGQYEVRRARLAPGDCLALYSDGITEARGAGENEYGEARLLQALRERRGQRAQEIADGVMNDVLRFRGSHPPHDDMTLLVVRREATT